MKWEISIAGMDILDHRVNRYPLFPRLKGVDSE